jgi:hypothetical protein
MIKESPLFAFTPPEAEWLCSKSIEVLVYDIAVCKLVFRSRFLPPLTGKADLCEGPETETNCDTVSLKVLPLPTSVSDGDTNAAL